MDLSHVKFAKNIFLYRTRVSEDFFYYRSFPLSFNYQCSGECLLCLWYPSKKKARDTKQLHLFRPTWIYKNQTWICPTSSACLSEVSCHWSRMLQAESHRFLRKQCSQKMESSQNGYLISWVIVPRHMTHASCWRKRIISEVSWSALKFPFYIILSNANLCVFLRCFQGVNYFLFFFISRSPFRFVYILMFS